ncbi:hypothetical protein GA0115254_109631 [Streptomyces sp. Ncost-T10-10d]|nr:hypothetical protein GA0115254_109631 [Streptomyces sp. Ncost-T10-10d]
MCLSCGAVSAGPELRRLRWGIPVRGGARSKGPASSRRLMALHVLRESRRRPATNLRAEPCLSAVEGRFGPGTHRPASDVTGSACSPTCAAWLKAWHTRPCPDPSKALPVGRGVPGEASWRMRSLLPPQGGGSGRGPSEQTSAGPGELLGPEAHPDTFDRQGLTAHLGARLTHFAPGRVHIALPARPEVTQQRGYVHARATSAIADKWAGGREMYVSPSSSDGVSRGCALPRCA